MNWDSQVVLWGFERQFVHESGHALMCNLYRLPCYGIAYDKTDPRFCTLRELPEEHAKLAESARLVFAAGIAAEQVVPSINASDWKDGAESDMAYFPDEESFLEAVRAATEILRKHKSTIEALRSLLMKKAKVFNGRVECLPECTIKDHRYAVLFNAQELSDLFAKMDSTNAGP